MNPSIFINLQTNFGSVFGVSLQNFSQYITTCNPCKCISTCMRYGEKTVFPFADDLGELVFHRCRSDKVEDKKFSGKKDFKMCKCGLNIRHAMIRSHIAANSAVSNLSKSTPLVLMTIEDPNYQPIMEELCSTERYIDAEIVHKKMIAERLLNGHMSFQKFSLLKTKIKPVLLQSDAEYLKYSNKRIKLQVENLNLRLLAYRIFRAKKLIERNFSPFTSKRCKFTTMHAMKPVKDDNDTARKSLLGRDTGADSFIPLKSMLLNKALKKNNCKSNIKLN